MTERAGAYVAAGMLLLACGGALCQTVTVQVDEADLAHYSYATLLGTGIYKLDDRTVTVIRLPIGWTFREPTADKYGIALKVPTAVGLYNYDVIDDLIPDSEHLSTISVMPGIELAFLVGNRWRVAPSVYLGYGTDLSSNESSVLYGAGITALKPLKREFPVMSVGTAVIMSGYDPGSETGDFIMRWSAGLDAKFPTSWHVANREIFVGGHVIGYYYLNRVEFQTIADAPIEIRGELEFGLFFGTRPAPKILGYEINRLGVGYRFSDVSDAIVFFAGFPF